MEFAEALEFWQENQLLILVLASLAIQWFLFVFAQFRQRRIPGLLRLFIWLAYLGSDAVAIFALATLFNSRRCDHTSGHLFVEIISAPILLVHLSGQDTITAYNIEDNELWRRHVLTAASQVAVASYVFFKPWPKPNVTTTHLVVDQTTTDRVKVHPYGIIFAPAFCVFVCGILMCVSKPWDLKRVSVNSLADSSVSEENGESEIISLQEYVGAATQYFEAEAGHGRDDICEVDEIWKPYNLCVDLAPPYSGRLRCLKHLVRNPDKAHRLVKSNLSLTFHQLYTKESLKLHEIWHLEFHEWWRQLTSSQVLRLVALAPLLLGILLFHDSSTDQDPTDVSITYVLLWSALVTKTWPTEVQYSRLTWPDHVAQYNLMGYVARSKKHSWLMKMAAWLGCKDLVDQLWTMKPCKGSSSQEITGLVHGHIAGGWRGGHIAGADSFRAFNDYRGQWTLNREVGVGRSIPSIVLMSVSRPFDESVLLWHLATDFCFHLLQDQEDASPSSAAAQRCKEMSNYMTYLLFVKPEMLMPGARRNLFRDACGGLVDVLEEDPPHEPRGLAHKVIQVLQRDGDGIQGSGSRVIRQAWSIAEDLMDSLRGDEEKMWRVIQGVWVEMLCFSASRCKGYLHAKSLGIGGEYLSYVWLLLLYMGMETLAEKMQRTELYEGPTAAASSIGGQNV